MKKLIIVKEGCVYMTKIDIISGFLGAGKTTLIKKLLEAKPEQEKLILIENEFGEIGIDGGFLKDAGIAVKEMNSGCICCSLVGDFSVAMQQVMDTYHPDRIIIEPSGVGKLSDVMKALQDNNRDDMVLNAIVSVVDGNKCKMYMKNFGEFYNDQVAFAKTIIVSRTQMLKPEKLAEVVHLLQAQNEQANLITTPWEELSAQQIISAIEQPNNFIESLSETCPNCNHHHEEHHHHDHNSCSCGNEHHHEHEGCACEHEHHHDHEGCSCGHEHHHHADDIFTSWGMETVLTFDKVELEKKLKELANTDSFGTILRAKGILASPSNEWLYFDVVPGEVEIRIGIPDTIGKLCVIGADLQIAKIQQLFGLDRG